MPSLVWPWSAHEVPCQRHFGEISSGVLSCLQAFRPSLGGAHFFSLHLLLHASLKVHSDQEQRKDRALAYACLMVTHSPLCTGAGKAFSAVEPVGEVRIVSPNPPSVPSNAVCFRASGRPPSGMCNWEHKVKMCHLASKKLRNWDQKMCDNILVNSNAREKDEDGEQRTNVTLNPIQGRLLWSSGGRGAQSAPPPLVKTLFPFSEFTQVIFFWKLVQNWGLWRKLGFHGNHGYGFKVVHSFRFLTRNHQSKSKTLFPLTKVKKVTFWKLMKN